MTEHPTLNIQHPTLAESDSSTVECSLLIRLRDKKNGGHPERDVGVGKRCADAEGRIPWNSEGRTVVE